MFKIHLQGKRFLKLFWTLCRQILFAKSDNTEFICFNQSDISRQNRRFLSLRVFGYCLHLYCYFHWDEVWWFLSLRVFRLLSLSLLLFPQRASVYIYFVIIQRVKARAIPCPHQPPTRGDNTVRVVQGGTATLGTTEH